VAHTAARLPPVSILFAAFLGYNPIQHLLGATALAHVSAHSQAILAGRTFFPQLISAPFRTGLHEAFYFAIAACVVAAAASLMRGKPYYPEEGEGGAEAGGEAETNGYRAAPVELRPRAREEQHAS
jgi:hypothetical protein